uniref:F-box domain-containing protein n=1 Tax=Peronospora matthiolae TaxID=2874970 RepID=A0AAV1T1J3_9STRA
MSRSSSRALILHPLHAPLSSAQSSPEDHAIAKWLCALLSASFTSKERRSLVDFTCDETVHAILSFLDGPSLCAARSVCHSWYRLGSDDQLWLNLCLHEFHVSTSQLVTQPESHQKLYQFACRSLKGLLRDYLHEQCLTNLQQSLRIPRAAALTLIASRSSL